MPSCASHSPGKETTATQAGHLLKYYFRISTIIKKTPKFDKYHVEVGPPKAAMASFPGVLFRSRSLIVSTAFSPTPSDVISTL